MALASASQQAVPKYASQRPVHAPAQIFMIEQGGADKIGMIKKKITPATNLYVDDVPMFARRAREIAKRITIKCRVSQPSVSRSWRIRRASIDSLHCRVSHVQEKALHWQIGHKPVKEIGCGRSTGRMTRP